VISFLEDDPRQRTDGSVLGLLHPLQNLPHGQQIIPVTVWRFAKVLREEGFIEGKG